MREYCSKGDLREVFFFQILYMQENKFLESILMNYKILLN